MIATLADAGRRRRDRRRDRHRRPRLVPARARSAHQGALQQARRLRLRALRRGRHRRTVPRRHARAVPRLRVAARRHERQPARRSRHRREDRGQADHDVRRSRRHLRTPRRAAAQAAHEPRRGARTACSRTARCRGCTSTSTSTASRTGTSRRARSTASACACCSTSSSSARCCRASSTRSATSPNAPEAETLDVDVVIARDAKAAAEALRAAANGERVALEARWAERPVERISGLAVSAGAEPDVHRRRPPRRRNRCATRSRRWPDPKGPPLVVHRAKELMHGLGLELRLARPRHRGDGVPARSRARGSTSSRTSRCGTSRSS